MTTTLIITFILVFLCLMLLGFSWFLTGKSRFKLGMCGRTPTEKRDNKRGCGTDPSCSICGKDDDKNLP